MSVIDFPTAWGIARATPPEYHHNKCSFNVTDGGMLCDCDVLHGKTEDPKPPRPMRRFEYRIFEGGLWHEISAHEIYFYDAGRVGFWNYDDNDDRVLVLGTKAFQVRQVTST